jgi:hypothetical protein
VRDQRSALPGTPDVKGNGYRLIIPRDKHGWEADPLRPSHAETSSAFAPLATAATRRRRSIRRSEPPHRRRRHWFPHQGNVSSALLVDYDGQIFKHMTAAPTKVVAVHGLIQF